MPFFRTATRLRVAIALCMGALIGACSVAAEDSGSAFQGESSATTGGYTSTGAGQTGSGGSLELSPDGGDRDGAGGATSYAGYCGTGIPCTPGSTGESANCNGGSPGVGGQGGGGGASSLSCQLVLGDDGEAAAACGPTGSQLAGGPCAAASDCAAGLGCVASTTNGIPSGGQCRDYCCGDPEACPGGTYCALEVMAESDGPSPAEIPACIPATNCELLSDEPQCPAGTTCTIVREDGTTSCIEPGPGKDCDPCPCAEGYVCSAAMNQCKKLCHTSGPDSGECGNGYCQGGIGNFPDGIGVCTGASGC